MPTKKETALAPAASAPSVEIVPATTEYPILEPGQIAETLEIFKDNVGPGGISTLDLPRIKCPTGGDTTWLLPTLDGDQHEKEIEGIVLAWKPARLFWRKSIAEGGSGKPPDCTSRDGFVGHGDPGGECAECPYAEFGSSSKGRGQACKQVRQMLLVRPGEILPHLITVPPTSLRNAAQYFLRLLGLKIPFWGVTTKIRLERARNEANIDYAKMTFLKGRLLTTEELAAIRPFHQQMKNMLDPVAIDHRDYVVVEDDTGATPAERTAE